LGSFWQPFHFVKHVHSSSVIFGFIKILVNDTREEELKPKDVSIDFLEQLLSFIAAIGACVDAEVSAQSAQAQGTKSSSEGKGKCLM